MSDENEYEDLDDDIINSLENPSDELLPEDVFKMVMINKARKVRTHVKLEDEKGDEVNLPETIEQLLNFVKSKLKDGEENQFADQILPLMSQSVVSGLGRMIGIYETGLYLTNETTRTAIIYMMAIGLLLLKFVQENNLTITTHEEPVSEEEIEEVIKKSKISSIATLTAAAGVNPREVLQQLVKEGKISEEDINEVLGEAKKDESNTNNKGNKNN
jgi:hypothetical protein